MRNLRPLRGILAILLIWNSYLHDSIDALDYGYRVEDFIRQFTSSFSRHALSYRDKNLDTEYLDALHEHFFKDHPHDETDEKPHHLGYGFPLRPPPSYPHPSDHGPDPSLEPHQQPSFIGALDLIAKNDDLRCVPRLLCEIFSGSNFKGSTKSDKDESLVPFLSKDGLIALLTVLNFVDDSPLLLFARAAFLGLSSKSDAKVCFNAYPLCPKDADQLVNYLNNHNGGFFSLFSHNPHHHHPEDTHGPDFRLSSPGSGFASRILNSAEDSYYSDSESPQDYSRLPIPTENHGESRLPIPSENHGESRLPIPSENHGESRLPIPSENLGEGSYPLHPSRTGKKFSFPGEVAESYSPNAMVFPQRTGNLVLGGDPSGEHKYTEDSFARSSSRVRFER